MTTVVSESSLKLKKPPSRLLKNRKQVLKVSEHPAFGMWHNFLNDSEVPEMVSKIRKSRIDDI